MSSAEALYTYRDAYPDVLERGRAQAIDFPVWRDGALVEITEAGSSVALFDPAGTEVWSDDVTVAGSIPTATIPALSLPSTLELGEGYYQEWTLVHADGTTRTKRRECAVALRALYPVVSDADLEGEYPDLDRELGTELTSWQGFIDEAWKQIIDRLRKEGKLPYLVVSATAFRSVHKHLALALIFKWCHRHSSGAANWFDLYKDHRDLYDAEWSSNNFTVDLDHDGKADSADRVGSGAIVHVNTSPNRRRRRDSRW